MNKLITIVALFAVGCWARSEVDYKESFTNWVQSYGKSYSIEDFLKRYTAFRNNLDYVENWNAQNNGVVLETNKFADLSSEEFRSMYLGLKFDHDVYTTKAKNLATFMATPPVAVDWRNSSAVTPVKDQGQCGSCWSFSTTGSVEGAYKLAGKTTTPVSLSEQNLMDCSTKQGNEGCNGGLMDQAFDYIISNKGIDTEVSYPYTAKDGTCHFNAANIGATISSYKDIISKNESNLLEAVGLVGPVSVAIDASHESFQLYKTGVYHQLLCSQTRLDHGVLAVGYGTSGSSDYWIVKNSWGADWGQSGYIWMSRNRSNNCGIATAASFPVV